MVVLVGNQKVRSSFARGDPRWAVRRPTGFQCSLCLADLARCHGMFGGTLEGLGVPPFRDLLAKLRDHEVPVFVRKGCAVARGANDDDLEKVAGSWITPPDVAKLFADSDRVVTF